MMSLRCILSISISDSGNEKVRCERQFDRLIGIPK